MVHLVTHTGGRSGTEDMATRTAATEDTVPHTAVTVTLATTGTNLTATFGEAL